MKTLDRLMLSIFLLLCGVLVLVSELMDPCPGYHPYLDWSEAILRLSGAVLGGIIIIWLIPNP